MSRDENRINPGHSSFRSILRIIGPVIFIIGALFALTGIIDFFSAFGGTHAPDKFWCLFVGLPLVAIGVGITQFAFMGAVARYAAGEYAPVAKDTLNYMADETSDSIRTIAGAIGEGLSGASGGNAAEVVIRCHKCNKENEADARFCDKCGTALMKTRACPNCNEKNDPDARFCDNCGKPLA
jgi:double zinc ribbon protein